MAQSFTRLLIPQIIEYIKSVNEKRSRDGNGGNGEHINVNVVEEALKSLSSVIMVVTDAQRKFGGGLFMKLVLFLESH